MHKYDVYNPELDVVLGRYPWNSIESMDPLCTEQIDSVSDRKRCLNCMYAECTNCLCKDKTSLMIDKCEELLSQHKTRQQICEILHISTPTFYSYKRACFAI